jgi:hypothetical protein
LLKLRRTTLYRAEAVPGLAGAVLVLVAGPTFTYTKVADNPAPAEAQKTQQNKTNNKNRSPEDPVVLTIAEPFVQKKRRAVKTPVVITAGRLRFEGVRTGLPSAAGPKGTRTPQARKGLANLALCSSCLAVHFSSFGNLQFFCGIYNPRLWHLPCKSLWHLHPKSVAFALQSCQKSLWHLHPKSVAFALQSCQKSLCDLLVNRQKSLWHLLCKVAKKVCGISLAKLSKSLWHLLGKVQVQVCHSHRQSF